MSLIMKPILLASLFGCALSNIVTQLEPNADTGAQHFQPVMDWDKDVCYHTAAMDANGNFNQGTEAGVSVCRTKDRLMSNNVYVRQRCNRGWCVYLYAYYAEQDAGPAGHRHDWEHAQIWTKNREIQNIGWSAHGKYTMLWAGDEDARYKDSHLKLVTHSGSGPWSTVSLRLVFPKDDDVENALGKWEQAWLIDLDRISPKLRTGLMQHSFEEAHLDLNDGRFEDMIIKYMPDRARSEGFDAAWDDKNWHWN